MISMVRAVGAAAVAVAIVGGSAADGSAQWRQTDVGWCDEAWGDRDRDRHCLTLEATFDAVAALAIDGGMNGGVEVQGWESSDIEVLAKVWANAPSEERAQEIAAEVDVVMERGRLTAHGPDVGRREGWGVSWEVRVPRETDLDIETFNGGIDVSEVAGRIRFEALNGGVRLTGVAGDVQGSTTNGGLHVELDGSAWEGQGLDVQTTNGGVTLNVPEGYSARLETGTVNGGIDIDFPVTVSGRIGKRLTTTLGEGGATLRAVTTNGGVRVVRGGSSRLR